MTYVLNMWNTYVLTWFSINRKFLEFSSLAFAWLNWHLIGAWSIEIGKFLVSKIFDQICFHASFVFRIHMHCIVFSLSILHFCSHFSHYFHTHHAYTLLNRYSTWFKNWLINFWFLYILVYAIFYVWTTEIFFFFWDIVDNKYANIFSTITSI